MLKTEAICSLPHISQCACITAKGAKLQTTNQHNHERNNETIVRSQHSPVPERTDSTDCASKDLEFSENSRKFVHSLKQSHNQDNDIDNFSDTLAYYVYAHSDFDHGSDFSIFLPHSVYAHSDSGYGSSSSDTLNSPVSSLSTDYTLASSIDPTTDRSDSDTILQASSSCSVKSKQNKKHVQQKSNSERPRHLCRPVSNPVFGKSAALRVIRSVFLHALTPLRSWKQDRAPDLSKMWSAAPVFDMEKRRWIFPDDLDHLIEKNL